MKKVKPGDKVIIKVNGKKVETTIDKDGVQRFPLNRIIGFVMRNNNDFFSYNALWEFIKNNMFSIEEARLIYQNNGYSICGYQEIFKDDVIENPLENKRRK